VYLVARDVPSRQTVRSLMNPAIGSPRLIAWSAKSCLANPTAAPCAFWIMAQGIVDPRRSASADPMANPHSRLHTSWLHSVAICFSILQRRVLTPNDFTSLAKLENHLLQFQEHYQQITAPLLLELHTRGSGSLLRP
jgi:hypothetical protein